MTISAFTVAIALDGTGFHPASWRDPSARPAAIFDSGYWVDLARTAERCGATFVTIEDALGLQSSRQRTQDSRTDQVRGRLDAVLIASFLAPLTTRLGLVPTAITTHTEPFHVASAISTLDFVSEGRAGWRPQVSGRSTDAAHVGRRTLPEISGPSDADDPAVAALTSELFDEGTDAVEVVRRLWDSWEDDAEIRDVSTGRFIDRAKLHYIDFEGRHFSVKGPSIVPRPPQGQPVVAALAHSRIPIEFAARSADLVFVTPAAADDVPRWVADVRTAERAVGRRGTPLQVFADLVVFLDETDVGAARRKDHLDGQDGFPYRSDAAVFVGTPAGLVHQLVEWSAAGIDGFRLRPAVIGHDLDAIADRVMPELARLGAIHERPSARTLRDRLGLERPVSRYATNDGGR